MIKNRTKGFTLLEIAISISIISALFVVSFAVYVSTTKNSYALNSAKVIDQIINKTVLANNTESSFSNINNQFLIDNEIIPDSYFNGDKFTDKQGNSLTVSNTGNEFIFTVNIKERSQCIKALPIISKNFYLNAIDGINVKNISSVNYEEICKDDTIKLYFKRWKNHWLLFFQLIQ